MNWLELELIAFGPFAGQTLDFSKSPYGLHLVYGKNEAGKSSTLRALRCFLYGFPRATGDDQNHEAKALRIGGRILRSAHSSTRSAHSSAALFFRVCELG